MSEDSHGNYPNDLFNHTVFDHEQPFINLYDLPAYHNSLHRDIIQHAQSVDWSCLDSNPQQLPLKHPLHFAHLAWIGKYSNGFATSLSGVIMKKGGFGLRGKYFTMVMKPVSFSEALI